MEITMSSLKHFVFGKFDPASRELTGEKPRILAGYPGTEDAKLDFGSTARAFEDLINLFSMVKLEVTALILTYSTDRGWIYLRYFSSGFLDAGDRPVCRYHIVFLEDEILRKMAWDVFSLEAYLPIGFGEKEMNVPRGCVSTVRIGETFTELPLRIDIDGLEKDQARALTTALPSEEDFDGPMRFVGRGSVEQAARADAVRFLRSQAKIIPHRFGGVALNLPGGLGTGFDSVFEHRKIEFSHFVERPAWSPRGYFEQRPRRFEEDALTPAVDQSDAVPINVVRPQERICDLPPGPEKAASVEGLVPGLQFGEACLSVPRGNLHPPVSQDAADFTMCAPKAGESTTVASPAPVYYVDAGRSDRAGQGKWPAVVCGPIRCETDGELQERSTSQVSMLPASTGQRFEQTITGTTQSSPILQPAREIQPFHHRSIDITSVAILVVHCVMAGLLGWIAILMHRTDLTVRTLPGPEPSMKKLELSVSEQSSHVLKELQEIKLKLDGLTKSMQGIENNSKPRPEPTRPSGRNEPANRIKDPVQDQTNIRQLPLTFNILMLSK